MKTGTLISGGAHAALIAAAVFGLPWFSPDQSDPILAASVSFVTEAEFEAAASGGGAQRQEPAVVLPPETVVEPELPVVEPEPVPPEEPQEDVASLSPGFDAQAPLLVPTDNFEPLSPVAPTPPLTPASPPLERPSERPEPLVVPSPQEEAEPEPEPVPDVADEVPEVIPEPEPAAEPALAAQVRPRGRPADLVAVVERPQAVAEPVENAAEVPEEPVSSQLRDLVASVTEPTEPTEPTVTEPSRPAPAQGGGLSDGPRLSAGERDGLRLAVQECWNVPAGLRDAQDLVVELAVELREDGSVIEGSIRIVSPDPIPDARYDAAYRAARRALIRCSPYNGLPPEKYSHWRSFDAVFNPKGMVSF